MSLAIPFLPIFCFFEANSLELFSSGGSDSAHLFVSFASIGGFFDVGDGFEVALAFFVEEVLEFAFFFDDVVSGLLEGFVVS